MTEGELIELGVQEFRRLVDSCGTERPIQEFLEQHPWMFTCHYDCYFPVVITQPPLGVDHRPDFAFFWRNSGGEFIAFVEIEPPLLQIFTADDEFSAAFNHAAQQLADWRIWHQENSAYLENILKPLTEKKAWGTHTFRHIELLLIAGRRNQLTSERRRKRWRDRKLEGLGDTNIQTYDGFIEGIGRASAADLQTACVRYSDQAFSTVYSP
ncbi:MAG: DUF4263 domain-containing protein [Verrucomicrobia bacterium]|nr:DUF4263 domain-containing protein [Verrucomicrobiota bacterium]